MEERRTIGIVGGGQLGRMLTLAAIPLGFKVVVVNPTPGGPAFQAGAEEIVANLYDQEALSELANKVDFITIEIEHLDIHTLEILASNGKSVNPSPKTIKLIQDKLLQKKYLKKNGIPVAPFISISNKTTALKSLKKFNGKLLLKVRHGGYDGRGNMMISSAKDIDRAFKLFKGRELYGEAFVPFKKELAVMVAKSVHGDVVIYPVVETVHQRNICIEVIAPAPISDAESRNAKAIATKVAKLLDGAGTFGIEMFLGKDGKVLVNEIAPRVHNSGHYTIEASRTSQFEQHIRAIAGLPLGSADMVVPAAVMINILGERDGVTKISGLGNVLSIPNISVHIYGKHPTKIDRKMGHITATAETIGLARRRARQARRKLSV